MSGMMIKNKYTVISLFCGGGGSSIGYHKAGFKELLSIDFEPNAIKTINANFDFPTICGDISKIDGNDILRKINLKPGDLDILDGSPPCQGFSKCNTAQKGEWRNQLYIPFLDIANILKPKIIVIENVANMLAQKFRPIFYSIINKIKKIEYTPYVKIMNAMYYEVPQSRKRTIFICLRNDIHKEIENKSIILNNKFIFPSKHKKIITVKEALKNCSNKDVNYCFFKHKDFKAIAQKLKQGQSADKLNFKGTYFNTFRLHNKRVCNTIMKTFRFGSFPTYIHPTLDRSISIEELKKLSSFPDNYILTGSKTKQVAILGNCVPPNLMYHISKNIKENVLDNLN